ncbi:translation elongation factor Ts [Buchnera aphidicola]|uniref:translation elongation factor Ts n=1 Tax=Buchnera aphidicola TaxID=9 RepID=UPI0015600220|nr:translation elongation factor Ts [Buchnera aphidicola]
MIMEISIKLIKELRRKTGSGFVECKTALQKSNGNLMHAIDYLRTLGSCIAEGKALHSTQFGRIFIYQDSRIGVLLEVNSETDFVANNDSFKLFGQKIVDFSGMNKLFQLSELNKIFDSEKNSYIAKFRENIVIQRIQHVIGDQIGSYNHLGKIGVVLSGTISSLKSKDKNLKYIAMHIAASKPLYLTEKEIPEDALTRERNIQQKIAEKTGKNAHVLDAIVSGRMNKYINDITLMRQNFIINPKIIVGEYLKENNISINSFVRFQVGDNIV